MASTAFQRLKETVENSGLTWKETEPGKKARFQTPGHSEKDLGTSVAYTGDSVLIYSHNKDTEKVIEELGLTYNDLYDNPQGVTYDYPDGRKVTRSPSKKFKQSGNTKGTSLYGIQWLNDNEPIYVVEGEKDVIAARTIWGANAVSQAMGASQKPSNADWTALTGRQVIVVADKDQVGAERACAVIQHLQSLKQHPKSISVVESAAGKDLADHIAAGYTPEQLIPADYLLPPARRITLTPASLVKTEKVKWLVDQWIPTGMLSLLAGREGIGKSTIACSWVAELTKKGLNTAYLNTEDSRSFTVAPRLRAAGADLNRVFFIDVTTETGAEGHLRLPQDTELLFREFEAKNVKFVVLDAAKSAMDPRLDGYKDDHVRQFLEPLAAAADRYQVTVLGLAHFGKSESKDTGRLMLGSIAWSQIARSVISVAVDQDAGGLVVSNTKANLANGIVSRRAQINSVDIELDNGEHAQVGAIVWGDFTDQSAAEFLISNHDDQDNQLSEAEAWLIDYLAEAGSTPRKTVISAANKAGISQRSIDRAFKKIGGKSELSGFPRCACWSLPDKADSGNTVGNTEHSTAEQAKQGQLTVENSSVASVAKSKDSTGNTANPPYIGKTGKAGKTEHDQHKRSGNTATVKSSTGNTAGNTVHPASPDNSQEIKRIILDALQPDIGLSDQVVYGLFPKKIANKQQVQEVLEVLLQQGEVQQHSDKKYYRPVPVT